jgi:hypothetical protein
MTAFIILLIGAVGSLFYMFKTGNKNSSILLMVIFFVWVVSPFMGLYIAWRMANKISSFARTLIFYFLLFLTAFSLILYSSIIAIPKTRPAFPFLLVPLVS